MLHRLWISAIFVAALGCGGGTQSTPAPAEPAVAVPTAPAATPPAEAAPAVAPAPPPADIEPVPAIDVHPFLASEQSFLVSSYVVVADGEALLVDAQMIQPDVEKLIAMIQELGVPLKTIFITHAHPDHYMGLAWLVAAFPEAKVVATAATAETIAAQGEATLKTMKSTKYMGGTLKKLLPAKVVAPTALEGSAVTVGKAKLEILTYPQAESAAANVLFEASTGTLITGDLVYDKVHLWLKDEKPAGWIAALADLDGRPQIKHVYPGHGEPGGPELISACLEYLKAFDAAVTESKKQKELIAAVKAKFPDYRLPAIVTLAAPSYFKK